MDKISINQFLDNTLSGYSRLERLYKYADGYKYFRVWRGCESYIVIDFLLINNNTFIFTNIAKAFSQAGINVPEIIVEDIDNGYLLLSGFGDEDLQSLLTVFPDEWLPICIDSILLLQNQGGQYLLDLPYYDENVLLRELSAFFEWFIVEILNIKLSKKEEILLNDLTRTLIDSAISQPQTWVHKNFYCKSLINTGDKKILITNFQDAILGPITYDLVTLLKDSYIKYPRSIIVKNLNRYYAEIIDKGLYYQNFNSFERSFNLMGLLYHLNCLGYFSSLSYRYNNYSYLNNLPLIFDYIFEVLIRYPDLYRYSPIFEKLGLIFENKVLR